MFLSELLKRVDTILDDTATNDNWPIADLIVYADLAVGDLTRQLVEVDKGYVDLDILIMESDWTENIQILQDYQLPPWVSNVVECWRLSSNPDTNNPHTNTVEIRRGTQIHATNQHWDPGYLYTQRNVLRVNRSEPAPSVGVLVAKRPARMIRVALTQAALSTTVVYIPQAFASTDLGTMQLEEDWYRNEQFQCYSTNEVGTGHPVLGATRRCVASTPNVVVGGAFQTQLTFAAAWPAALKAGDVLELEVVVPDEHSELVVLEVAGRAFLKKQSKDGLASIVGERALARASYRNYIQPRSMREPDFYRSNSGIRRATDFQGRDPDMWQYL